MQLDLVFVMDSSWSVLNDREDFVTSFRGFLTPLVDCGALLRVAVITADLGVGDTSAPVEYCSVGGDAAIPLSLGLSDYTSGGLSQVVDDIAAALGARPVGCGFERPLEAVLRFVRSERFERFHRPDARLVVFIATEEDDCGAADPSFFDPNGPQGSVHPNIRCAVADPSLFIPEAQLADSILASVDEPPLAFAILAGFREGDLHGSETSSQLLGLAEIYEDGLEQRDERLLRGCGNENPLVPRRLTRFAAALEERGGAVALSDHCSDASTLGNRLVSRLLPAH